MVGSAARRPHLRAKPTRGGRSLAACCAPCSPLPRRTAASLIPGGRVHERGQKSLRSGPPPRRAPHATHFTSYLCPSTHFPRGRSTSTDLMPLEAADVPESLQVVAGHPGTAPFEGLLGDSNHPHADRRPVSKTVTFICAKGTPLCGQQSFWRVRQSSRDFPVSRSEQVPTGASHRTRRLISSAQRAPQWL